MSSAATQNNRVFIGEVYISHEEAEGIRVALISRFISNQLPFISLSKNYITIRDTDALLQRTLFSRRRPGKLGGKAAGMILAHKILQREGAARGIDVAESITLPESWFLGSDVFYDFKASNDDLFQYMNQKYRRPEQMVADYPAIYDAHLAATLPVDVQAALWKLLEGVGQSPLIVRSSSLLEDNFDTSFAGKYESHFCPNQGTPEQNLWDLTQAIQSIYASMLNPDALLYRRAKGLQDYDERMAILIQVYS